MKLQRTPLMNSLYAIAIALACGISSTVAQVAVLTQPTKSLFVAYEPTRMNVTITNHAGQTVVLKNNPDRGWIEFIVENGSGRPLPIVRRVAYKGVAIPAGRAVTSTFTINNSYDLTRPGNYSAYALIHLPGQGVAEGIRSNKVHFTVVKGHPSWSQRAGVPGKRGATIEYRIMNVSNGDRSDLYVQLEDVKRGRMLATYSMGRSLTFRNFKATLDNKNNLHVLFLTTPSLFCHTVVNLSGKTILREYHKKAGGVPDLVTTASGAVGVINSVVYDPAQERKKKLQIHKLSEIPAGL